MALVLLSVMMFLAAINNPSRMKPPGGSNTRRKPSYPTRLIFWTLIRDAILLKISPLPISSRRLPRMINTKPNPSPWARPSTRAARGGLREAKLSARPKMVQLVTMRGRKIPSD